MKIHSAISSDPLSPALAIALAIIALALVLGAWRLWRGPTDADRVLALDLITGIGLALIVLLAIAFGEPVLLDVALAFAVFGFVGTAALARWLDRGGKLS